MRYYAFSAARNNRRFSEHCSYISIALVFFIIAFPFFFSIAPVISLDDTPLAVALTILRRFNFEVCFIMVLKVFRKHRAYTDIII